MNCHDARRMLHQALDNDLTLPAKRQLESHLQACGPCQKVESSLGQVVSLLEQLSNVSAPSNFTAELMQQLPRTKPVLPWFARVRAVCAVAILCLLIVSPLYVWGTLSRPQLIADDWQAIVQEGNRFIVPAGQVIQGDLVIYKAVLEIQGEVQGTIKTVDATIEFGPNGRHVGSARTIDASPQAKLAVAWAELWERIKQLLGGND
ncbi:MAG TPA: hypothetical protein GX738_01365 [Firmicutes bacterium]|nr:hypothetical protein [Bacillota bacterium]